MLFFYFLSATVIGLIVYTLGRWGLAISLFAAGSTFIAIALVIAALILLYRKYRSRERAGRPRRLLP
jgi:hypothetical protein